MYIFRYDIATFITELIMYMHVYIKYYVHVVYTLIGLQAPSSLKHQASPVAATKKTKTVFKRRESKAKPEASVGDDGQGEKITSLESSGGAEPRPSTPPPREEAFEQFKRERGCEINKILLLNKG